MTFGFHTCFTLGRAPLDGNGDGVLTDADFTVFLDDYLVEPRGGQHQRIWSYVAASNQICFNPLAVPEPDTEIRVEYNRVCP